MLARALLVAAVLAFLITPRPASACSKRHQTVFELFESAARVAEVRVVQTPPPRKAGMAELRVLRTLKGGARRTLQGAETNTSCHVGYRTGRRAVVFLGPRGETLGHYEGYLERPADDPLLAALRAYAAAPDADRVSVLVDAIASGSASMRDEAAYFLVDRPDLIARIDIPGRERLLAAYTADRRDQPLIVVLARLGLPVAPPPPTPYRNVYTDMATVLLQRSELDDLGVAALADRLDRGGDGHDPDRIRAMDRCEQLHARRLFALHSYGAGVSSHLWPKLAEACRTGEPVRW